MVLAAVLGLSTCISGLFVDDYVHLLSIEGRVPTTSPFDLFNFASGKPGEVTKMMGFLPFPWFTYLDVKLHFFRLLSCATMVLDHSLFGRNPVAFHAQSALWYVAFVWGAWLIFKRSLPRALAGLAIVLFAMDFGHVLATAWWSNRNALVAVVPALYGLWAHLRWREDGWRWGLPLSLVLYALGLSGGEMAIGVFGYLGAYELFGDRGPWVRRIAALVPAGLLAVAYLAIYKANGYGTHGSGIYIDPAENPLQFLLHAPERILMLIAAQFFLAPVEIPAGSQAAFWPILVLCAVLTALTVHLARDAWKDFDDDAHRGLIWLVAGALFSCAPVLSTFASARLLMGPSIGAIPLLAAILLHLRVAKRRGLRAAYVWLFFLHVILAPLTWPGLSFALGHIDTLTRLSISRAEIDNSKAADQIVIVPVAPDPLTAMYTVVMREYDGNPRLKAWLSLSMAQCAHRLSRPAANQLELELVNGEYLDSLFEQLLRSPEIPFHVGERITLPQMTVEILALGPKAMPNRVRFEFPGDLDQPPYVFLKWKEDHLARFTLPKVGETMDFPLDHGILDGRLLFGARR